MIGTYETNDEMKKISAGLIFFSLSVFLIGTYTYYFPFFESKGISNEFFYHFALSMYRTFDKGWIIKLLILVFASAGILTFTTKNVIGKDKKKFFGGIGFSFMILYIFLIVVEVLYSIPSSIALFIHSSTYFISFSSLLLWRMRVANDLKEDRRNMIESQFDQERNLVETDNSVNIIYSYYYLGELRYSNINILQPYRGTLIGGVPGSGKSFAVIEEFMRQMIKKNFTGVIYDFKFPTLTTKAYNYFRWYEDTYKIKPSFYMVNFDDPEYSHRCNPISVDTLKTISDAEENTKVLMLNINKTWLEKEGDFFTDSANQFSAMLLWYLKLATEKYGFNVCTFPHLVALASFGSTEILFFIILKYEELKSKMKSFAEAMDKEAFEQLAGQVASATTALAKVSSKELDYIMSGDDFSFDLNDPMAPKILCIGNNPDRQIVYSPSIGLVLTKLSKTMNKQQKEKSFFVVDEFPTVYVRGIDVLIATGRSNKIAPILGFQTLAQVTADYGKETADKIIRDCGNRIMGQLFDEDAELISKTIGKQKVLQRSFNYSQSDISENQQVNMEDIVPPERISQFSQGTFCGVIADEFQNKEQNKVFYGDIVPPIELKNMEEKMDIPKIREFISKEEKKAKSKKYVTENANFLERIIEILISNTPMQWVNIIEKLTTNAKFDKYLIQKFSLEEDTLKEFSAFIKLKTVLKTLISKENRKHEKKGNIHFMDKPFEKDFIRIQINNWIEEGFAYEAKEEYLKEYSRGIKEDIYRLVALELIELGIVQTFVESQDSYYRKHKRVAIRLFKSILKEQKFKDKYTSKLYEDIVEELEQERV